jgi:hypothetical protein
MALLRVNDEKVIRVLCIQKLSLIHIIIILLLKTYVYIGVSLLWAVEYNIRV